MPTQRDRSNRTNTQQSTTQKTKPKFDFDNIFQQQTFSSPTVNPNRQQDQQQGQQAPDKRRASGPLDAMTPNQALPQINTDDLEDDDIDDATAARIAGRQALDTDTVEPEPPQPTYELANIVRDIAAAGTVSPEFRTVAQLPGYMANAIRKIGRTVFKTYTTTPIEDIDVLANVQGQGPNSQREMNAVAGWARNNATLDQQTSEAATADFGNVIPGYTPKIQVYDAGGTAFMVVRDDMGDYIYSWPSSTNVSHQAPAGRIAGRTIDQLPHLESFDFKTFLRTV